MKRSNELISIATVYFVTSLAPCRADDIKTIKGVTYSNASVMRAERDGITIRISSGIVKIPFNELDAETQKRYSSASSISKPKSSRSLDDALRVDLKASTAPSEGSPIFDSYNTPSESGGFSGAVLQVLDSGALMMPSGVRARIKRGLRLYAGYDDNPIFVEGDFSDYVDDDTWTGVIRREGAYRYESVGGGIRSVKRYVIVKEQKQNPKQ